METSTPRSALLILSDDYSQLEVTSFVTVFKLAGVKTSSKYLLKRACVLIGDSDMDYRAAEPLEINSLKKGFDIIFIPSCNLDVKIIVPYLLDSVKSGSLLALTSTSYEMLKSEADFMQGSQELIADIDNRRTKSRIVMSGNLVIGKGPGSALELALTVIDKLDGANKARDIAIKLDADYFTPENLPQGEIASRPVTHIFSISKGVATFTNSRLKISTNQTYSGYMEAANDITKEYIRDTGPLPHGKYVIIEIMQGWKNQRNVAVLNAAPGTDLKGRFDFLIHADNGKNNRSGSQGCIVVDDAFRESINVGDYLIVLYNQSHILSCRINPLETSNIIYIIIVEQFHYAMQTTLRLSLAQSSKRISGATTMQPTEPE
eukprot:TRINITY_DN2171_c0_g1_i11.p1 TRINITY_DN2171_c0_g1~~TRINITY_DN2171_c0_g1_i11.p1  ORF type:complete len:376 (-),score=35.55 TRINITY_DN2171_c0_g1_i11:22-1149(-)